MRNTGTPQHQWTPQLPAGRTRIPSLRVSWRGDVEEAEQGWQRQGDVTGVIALTQQLAQMAAEVRPSTSGREEPARRKF